MVGQSHTKNASAPDDDLLGQAANEFFDAAARGERPAITEFAQRYPAIAEEIRVVFPALALVGDSMTPSAINGSTFEFNAPRQLGDYRLIREIGRGGMGLVFEAEQMSIGRRVALKVLPFANLAGENALKRFQNEIRTAASLEHPHIVSVFASGEERGVHFFAMQLIRGRSLAEFVKELRRDQQAVKPNAVEPVDRDDSATRGAPADTVAIGKLSTERTTDKPAFFRRLASLAEQACDALQYAHDMGVVHRDIKPSNLIIDGKCRLWLADFGLALVQADAGLTLTGDLVGTLRYMSPEQALGKSIIDHRTDVYSLGATLYELATLHPPFDHDDRQQLLRMIAEQDPPAPRACDADIPTDLETIIRKAMEKDPADRYGTVGELAEDLQLFAARRPIRARRPSMLDNLNKWSRRHRGLMWSAAAMLLATSVGLGLTAWAVNVARNEAVTAKNDAIDAKKVAVTETERAAINLDLALEAIDDLCTNFAADKVWMEPKLQSQRQAYLLKALIFYQRFAEQNKQDMTTWPQLAHVYLRIGDIHRQLGQHTRAMMAYLQFEYLFERLAPVDNNSPDRAWQSAQLQIGAGAYFGKSGRYDEAMRAYSRGIEILENFGEPFALPNPSGDSKWERVLASGLAGLGVTMKSVHRLDDADRLFPQALAIQRRLVERYPHDDEVLAALARSMHEYAMLYFGRNQLAQAEQLIVQAISLEEQALAASGENALRRRALWAHHLLLADVLAEQDDFVRANTHYQLSCDIAERSGQEIPEFFDNQQSLGEPSFSWACVLYRQGDVARAEQKFRECLARLDAAPERFFKNSQDQLLRSMALEGLALVLSETQSPGAQEARTAAWNQCVVDAMFLEDVSIEGDIMRDARKFLFAKVVFVIEGCNFFLQALDDEELDVAMANYAKSGGALVDLKNAINPTTSDAVVRQFVQLCKAVRQRHRPRLIALRVKNDESQTPDKNP